MSTLINSAKLTIIVLLSITLMSFKLFESVLGPKSELWPRWGNFNPLSRETIDHRQWDLFLKVYLKKNDSGINLFAYDSLGKGSREALGKYIETLNKTPISLYSRNEQKAFWINLYNALTVQLIMAHYPVNSILEIPSAWDKKLARVEGVGLSLNDIQHKILRPIWNDALIHYSINHGALSSPNLLKIAFTGRNASQLMELAAHNYINNHHPAHIKNGRLVISKIYSWFKEDFGGTDQDIIFHLRNYAELELLEILEGKDSIENYEFDWSLNDSSS